MADDTDDLDATQDEATEVASRGTSHLASGSLGEYPVAGMDDTAKQAGAESVAAALGSHDDAEDATAGDAAGVPVSSEEAAAGTSETFPPLHP